VGDSSWARHAKKNCAAAATASSPTNRIIEAGIHRHHHQTTAATHRHPRSPITTETQITGQITG
jgi:hypothetical protein